MERTLYFFAIYIAEALIWLEYAFHVFQPKRSRQLQVTILFAFYTGLFFISCYNLVWLNVLSFLLANFLHALMFYNLRWYTALFHASTATAVMFLCELATYRMIYFFPPEFSEYGQPLPVLITWIVLNKTLYFIILFVLSHILKEKEIHLSGYKYDLSSCLLIFIPVISTGIMLILFSISSSYQLDTIHEKLISAGAVSLLFANLFMFVIYSYSQRKNKLLLETQLLLQREQDASSYYKSLLQQNENQRILIHDIKKHLQSISLLNTQGNAEKVDDYINRIIQLPILRKDTRTCDNDLLNMILLRYENICAQKAISFNLDIRSSVLNFMDEHDMTSLFCNLLDNSVESSEQVPGGYIDLNIEKREPASVIVIAMTNSCQISPFSGKGSYLVSRKPNGLYHGLGMKSIYNVINKYQGNHQIYYDSENASFHIIITLPTTNH